jgi:hypothetical protein
MYPLESLLPQSSRVYALLDGDWLNVLLIRHLLALFQCDVNALTII